MALWIRIVAAIAAIAAVAIAGTVTAALASHGPSAGTRSGQAGTAVAVAGRRPSHASGTGSTGSTGQGGSLRAASSPRAGTPTGPASSPGPAASPGEAGAGGPSVLPRLSARQLAGQRVIYSYRGLKPPPSLLELIRRGDVAGVMFFAQNVASAAQIGRVIRDLAAANASPDNPVRAPLLLMTDQEGGVVRRLPGAPLESARQIGESADPAAGAAAAGTGAGDNLRGVGMNVNLAPVLDVYRTPGDFDDQYGRSYSTNPAAVSVLGADFIVAQQRAGVAATAKHFPGLGSAGRRADTDHRPVSLRVPAQQLRTVDELPYRAAIAAGVRLVMVSWAEYPALAPGVPAGLSPVIVRGELRDRLGFRGVTITDALEAGALRTFGGFGRRGLLAARAGMDLLLCSGKRVSEGTQAAAGLEAGYRDGQLGRAAFTVSVSRILALRYVLRG